MNCCEVRAEALNFTTTLPANPGITRLVAPIASPQGNEDLCITYTAKGVNPMWAIDSVELIAP